MNVIDFFAKIKNRNKKDGIEQGEKIYLGLELKEYCKEFADNFSALRKSGCLEGLAEADVFLENIVKNEELMTSLENKVYNKYQFEMGLNEICKNKRGSKYSMTNEQQESIKKLVINVYDGLEYENESKALLLYGLMYEMMMGYEQNNELV